MNRWKTALLGATLGIFGSVSAWAGAEIGASVTAQRYENAGREALYLAITATGNMDYQTAKEKLNLSKEHYSQYLWWSEAAEKFGPYSLALQWAGREIKNPEELELLKGLERLLETVAPEGGLQEGPESETERSM